VVSVEVIEVLELIYITLKVRRVDEVVEGVRESLKGSREVCLDPTSSSI
jgi:hypothetical protein